MLISTADRLVFVVASPSPVEAFGQFVLNVYRCFGRRRQPGIGRAELAFALGLLVVRLMTMAVIAAFDGTIS